MRFGAPKLVSVENKLKYRQASTPGKKVAVYTPDITVIKELTFDAHAAEVKKKKKKRVKVTARR